MSKEKKNSKASSRPKPRQAQGARKESGKGPGEPLNPETPAKPEGKGQDRFFVVGIGASAGGLEPLEMFLRNLPPDPQICLVIVVHLLPDQKSQLPDLLQKKVNLPVEEARDGARVEKNHVYVIPPNKNMGIMNGRLHLLDRTEDRIQSPIDIFLQSLGEDQDECAVAIILSGTGTDGTLGIKAIKEHAGLVMVQDPRTAKFTGMPLSAIDTNLVDFVLPPEDMPAQLLKYVTHSERRMEKREKEVPENSLLQKIFFLLRTKTGHDFSLYKKNTIQRRIERRMTVHQIEEVPQYNRYLQENPHEVSALFKELLIGVTSFFRDPESYKALREKALPHLLKNRSMDHHFRVWVPGAATGEEAYSLTMVFEEFLQENHRDCHVQVFATDIDPEAIEVARTGEYPESIRKEVSEDRLRRFFEKSGARYRVKRDLREHLVFAAQNVIKDPPFTKLDLICCRNLLIYLEAELQQKLLPLFHYSLLPGGILVLGSSESLGEYTDLFDTLDSKWKIYRRRDAAALTHHILDFPMTRHRAEPRVERPEAERGAGLGELTRGILLQEFAPASVIVTQKGDILYIHGRTGKYLEPAPGEANWNILEMAREGLRILIPSAIRKASTSRKEVRHENVRVQTNGTEQHINLIVRPLSKPHEMDGLLMVLFEDVSTPASQDKAGAKGRKNASRHLDHLEQELKDTRENLQTTIEELETSNEELKSMNEEYQSTNEELKSANEELETSREELQSLNEELSTVNSELQEKILRLSRTHEDMKLFLDTLDVPMVFLDNELRIRRYTCQAAKLIHLIDQDVGRPLRHIATNLDYANLVDDAAMVRDTIRPAEREIRSADGHDYLVRILPYRSTDNRVEGVVITFINTDFTKKMEKELVEERGNREFARSVLETLPVPVLVLDLGFKVVWASPAYCRKFDSWEQEITGKSILELGKGRWDGEEIRALLSRIHPPKSGDGDFQIEKAVTVKSGERYVINARRILFDRDTSKRILLTILEAGTRG